MPFFSRVPTLTSFVAKDEKYMQAPLASGRLEQQNSRLGRKAARLPV